MGYVKTIWNAGTSPGISDANLNKIENAIANLYATVPYVKIDETTVNNTNFTAVASVGNVNIIDVEISLYKYIPGVENEQPEYHTSERIAVKVVSGSVAQKGFFYITLPGTATTTRYRVDYNVSYASNMHTLYVKLPSALLGLEVVTKWTYKEG